MAETGAKVQGWFISFRSAPVTAATLIVALAGCGTTGTSTPTATKPANSGSTAASPTASPATNGLENQTAAKVAQAADAAFKTARSVHIRGTFLAGRTEKFNLRYEGGSTRGTFTINGATIHMVTVGDKAYLNADKRGLAAMGNPPDTQGLLANK